MTNYILNYVADNEPYDTFENELKRTSGHYKSAKAHFQAVNSCVPTLRGIGIFDNDNGNRTDEIKNDLALLYWRKYEFENYFAFPYIIEDYVADYFSKQGKIDIELNSIRNITENAINEAILSELLNNNQEAFQGYLRISGELKRELFKNFLTNRKASQFLDMCFKNISEKFKLPLLLNKGNYYELIKFINQKDVDPEIKEKLDYLSQYLS